MTGLDFSPKILNGKTLDPYSHSVDVKWDAHWPWNEDEEGFGLEMLYDLRDDVKELKFEFDDAPGGKGDMGGVHDLLVDPSYMKEASNFFTSAYNVKWEGFDSTINDEDASRIYAYPDEAEKNSDGISPGRIVKEGKYLHRIELKRDKD